MKRPLYIKVTDVALFDALYAWIEARQKIHEVQMERQSGYYLLYTIDRPLWEDLYLYGQMLAQAQDLWIEGGEI